MERAVFLWCPDYEVTSRFLIIAAPRLSVFNYEAIRNPGASVGVNLLVIAQCVIIS